MAVLALVTETDDIGLVVPWAFEFADSRDSPLSILCWVHSAVPVYPLLAQEQIEAGTQELVSAVRQQLEQVRATRGNRPDVDCTIHRSLHPDSTAAVLQHLRVDDVDLVVAAAPDQTGRSGASYDTNPLLKQSPRPTVILFGGPGRGESRDRILAITGNEPHAREVVACSAPLAGREEAKVSIVRFEDDSGEDAMEVGRQELRQLLREAGVKRNARIRTRVFLVAQRDELVETANDHDLVLLGANRQAAVELALESTTRPVVAVVKKPPPLRLWRRGPHGIRWIPRLSAGDYADLVQGLRRGSRLDPDFSIMLGLAAAIATLGLLQSSAAVVIGSMLLAPLMTPMLTTGLGLAQANPQLVRSALRTIFFGFLMTLGISFVIAIVTPGSELTPEVVARGDPNILDLLIAVFSASAAAYALARPNIAGAIAGVAIATALVPPLCSLGISLAYFQFGNAYGAALLFATNLVAIVLGAAATFRLMGVSSTRADATQRRWIFRSMAVFAGAAIVMAIPLELALERNIEQGKPQPRTFPLAREVENALAKHVDATRDVSLIATGRPSSPHADADVVVVLATQKELPVEYADELIAIVRDEMDDQSLRVEVHCVQGVWGRTSQ